MRNDFTPLRRQIEQFVPLTDADWAMLEPHLRIETIRKHQLFAEEGAQADQIALVLEGAFRQFYTKDGQERTTYFFFENHFLSAYVSCISRKPSLITIEALSDGQYISFSYRHLVALMDVSLTWQKFGRLVGEYVLRGLEERMAGLLMDSPEERYLALLESSRRKIIDRVPQHYVANYLGITPVSLSRIRNRIMSKH
jgi:CRP-like cAMP-binding protein